MPPITSMYGQSPHSSSGIFGSSEGTPDTRFTAFSPEDSRPLKLSNEELGVQSGATQQDPFVTITAQIEQKLSATASPFTPFHLPLAQSTPAIELIFSKSAALPGSVQKLNQLISQTKSGATASAVFQGAQQNTGQYGAFTTDTDDSRCIQITSTHQDVSVHQAVVTSLKMIKARYTLQGSERVEHGVAAAYLRYSNVNDAVEVYKVLKSDLPRHSVEYITPDAFASAVHSPSKGSYSAHEGQIVLTATYPVGTPCNKKAFESGVRSLLIAYGPLRASQIMAATEAGKFRMVAEFCDSAVALQVVQRLNRKDINFGDGDVAISIGLHTPDIAQLSQRLGTMTTPTRRSGEQSDIGDALNRMSLVRIQAPSLPSRAETPAVNLPGLSGPSFMAPTTSAYGLTTPVPVLMGGVYAPAHIAFPQAYPSVMHQPYIGGGDFDPIDPLAADFGHNNPAIFRNSFDQGYINPTAFHNGFNQQGFHQLTFQPQGIQQQNYGNSFGYSNPQSSDNHRDSNYFSRPSSRRQNVVRAPHQSNRGGRQFPNPAAGHHNHVDVHRIRQGIDVRTTVMLRNIPNKVDQAMLKEIVDESSFGRYDFMYLRIDFSNDCNVGYAFINFADPLDIIDFVVARSNQKWHRFKSDKVAEVSYATIQGRDCLIQKFRNSSVMLEPPHYRPKLFFTIHDHTGRVGEEDQFPSSDNASKLKRSCENAEHVGLFAPSAGQHLRDEQRRRRSQFDRGTSLAEREEYGYDEGAMHSGYRPPYY